MDSRTAGVNPYFETVFAARLPRSMITSELLKIRELFHFNGHKRVYQALSVIGQLNG